MSMCVASVEPKALDNGGFEQQDAGPLCFLAYSPPLK